MCKKRLSVAFECHGCQEAETTATDQDQRNSTARQSIEMPELYLPPPIDISDIQDMPDLSNESNIARGCDELDAAMPVDP